jgi:hypothetical protein
MTEMTSALAEQAPERVHRSPVGISGATQPRRLGLNIFPRATVMSVGSTSGARAAGSWNEGLEMEHGKRRARAGLAATTVRRQTRRGDDTTLASSCTPLSSAWTHRGPTVILRGTALPPGKLYVSGGVNREKFDGPLRRTVGGPNARLRRLRFAGAHRSVRWGEPSVRQGEPCFEFLGASCQSRGWLAGV